MVCFDLESLFTNVPIKGAAQAELRKLESGTDLPDRTMLTPDQLTDFLNFALRFKYFQYKGSISLQTTKQRSHGNPGIRVYC